MPFLGTVQTIHPLLTVAIVLVVFGAGKLGQVIRNRASHSGV